MASTARTGSDRSDDVGVRFAPASGAGRSDTVRTMSTPTDLAATFAELHQGDTPLLMANAWDIGTAKSLAFLGYRALATTSAGHAAVLGRHDGGVSRDEAIAHAAELTTATGLPVNGDFEHGFADEPEDAAETYRLASEAGVVAASIEDWNRDAAADVRRRVGGRPRRRGGRGRPRRPCTSRPHGPLRAPHPWHRRPRRHDRPSPGVPGGRRRRARTRPASSRPTRSGPWSVRSTVR